MSSRMNRRQFIEKSVISSAGGAVAMNLGPAEASAERNSKTLISQANTSTDDALPKGKIGDLEVSRIMLGGNLLTHFTHSRDLRYVYDLAAHYNTEEKIKETLAVAEAQGIDTLVIHTHPWSINVIKEYRYSDGGKIKWIICPTAPIDDTMEEYRKQVREVVEMGTEAVYLWGVRGDELVAKERIDLMAKAVAIPKEFGVPSGVGAHDLRAIVEAEKNDVGADFYIKTFHHHDYPTGPKPEELTEVIAEVPGYWCKDPEEVAEFMKRVEKPWIAFKVMAAGAIPPENAFQYAFDKGADHVLAGMFDFEIAHDVRIAKEVLAKTQRTRPWWS